MAPIKTVAVLGGSTGNLGPSLIHALHNAGFTVTAITRPSPTPSTNTTTTTTNPPTPNLPPDTRTLTADYASVESLTAAFSGQDAVVSAVGTQAVGTQHTAVDAAVAAGVQRFVPSEFGIHTRLVRERPIGRVLAGKVGVVDYLEGVVERTGGEGGLSWTGVSTGLFFDWGLERSGLGTVNIKDKTATVIDSGDEKWYASTLAQIGRVVAGILKHPDETANKYIATASFNLSQNELIAIVEELTGWKLAVTKIKSADLQQSGEAKLAAGDYSAFVDLLRAHNSADGAGNGLPEEESANGLIGVPYEDVRESVKSWLQREGAL
ncbi:uncharacterized protein B0H64DRAFT_344989 [Chaetomium fimeti]|uniref:NmrA-like domain-containing protein n=1 Tax=Chaetomium fimeti TaxID=1854472 RepID=A0AAE0LPM5_9PEZI|nr:hypothetical protein B0H64DRAFT_344989 [Chaetomium fimeti]